MVEPSLKDACRNGLFSVLILIILYHNELQNANANNVIRVGPKVLSVIEGLQSLFNDNSDEVIDLLGV